MTHIRTRLGVAFCGAIPAGPWESISLPHWQTAQHQPDRLGLDVLPVPVEDPLV